jgi:hypothetical protein
VEKKKTKKKKINTNKNNHKTENRKPAETPWIKMLSLHHTGAGSRHLQQRNVGVLRYLLKYFQIRPWSEGELLS